MNKNTLIGVLAIFLLFMWSLNSQAKQEQQRKKMLLEKRRADSLLALSKSLQKNSDRVELKAKEQVESQKTVVLQSTDSVVSDSSTEHKDSLVAQVINPRTIVVRTKNFDVMLDSRGAFVRSLVMHALADSVGHDPELLLDTSKGMLKFGFDKKDFGNEIFAVDTTLPDTLYVQDKASVEFVWSNLKGQKIVRTYAFTKDGRNFNHSLKTIGFDPRKYSLRWDGGMRETEHFLKGSMGSNRYFFSEFILHSDFNVLRETPKEETKFNEETGKASWAGLRRKYSAVVFQFNKDIEATFVVSPLKEKLDKNDPGTYSFVVKDKMPDAGLNFDVVVLPLNHSLVTSFNQDYEKIIFSGWESFFRADIWFVGLCGLILKLLNLFYQYLPNYGVAIILLTLLVKFVTLPLTLKQVRSMKKMQVHKPAIDAIRAKYKSDPKKMNAEMMAYYSSAGINPLAQMAGCLPMFFQMPIFFSLFIVLGRAVELRNAPFVGWITDLSQPDILISSISIPMIMPLGISLLPFIMAGTTYFQTKQTMTDPNMKAMLYVMPLMLFVFSGVMPSGLVLYWIVSNIFSIIQYLGINRGKEDDVVVPAVASTQRKAKSRR